MKILIIAEHDNKNLKSANYHTVAAGEALGGKPDVLVIGFQCESVVAEAQKLPGINRVFVANKAPFEHQLAENSAKLIRDVGADYDYILTSASTFGKNCLPRVAALLDVSVISDVINIISPDTFVRPIYAGNAFATVQTNEKIKMLTIRPTAFPAVQPGTSLASVENISASIENPAVTFLHQELTVSARPELTSAKIIVSGGRGLKSKENFKRIEALADRLGAAVGASRAAVDAGFAPNDYQVGQTGKVVAPNLYIAIGISGAIQHLAGMKDSKVIVAINNDPDAPIFQIADYGLVGDLFTVLDELEAELNSI